jgi:hypothetical protein
MFGQFGSKKNPCNMRFMHYHSMHYDNFYCILFPLQLEVGTTVVIVFDGIENDLLWVVPISSPSNGLCTQQHIHRISLSLSFAFQSTAWPFMHVYALSCFLQITPRVALFRSSDLTWFSAPQGRLIESAKTSPSVRRTDTSLQKHGSDIMGTPSRTESPWT